MYSLSDISKNRLLEIPPELIEHGQSLEELDVYHNSIRNIPDSIHQLRNLTFLNLRSASQESVLTPPGAGQRHLPRPEVRQPGISVHSTRTWVTSPASSQTSV